MAMADVEKSSNAMEVESVADGKDKAYGAVITLAQEQFINSILPEERDKIFRKVRQGHQNPASLPLTDQSSG